MALLTNQTSKLLLSGQKAAFGPGQPLLAGYPMGLLLLLTYSATVV